MTKQTIRSAVVLGDLVRDSVTGFQGIAIARTSWLNGCDRICVQPQKLTKEGLVRPDQTFDEMQLIIVTAGVVKGGWIETGGPRPNAARPRNLAIR